MGHDGGDHGHHHDHHSHDSGPAHEHRAAAPAQVAVFAITCSDTRTASDDEGGRALRTGLEQAGHTVVGQVIVRDEADALRAAIAQGLELGARAVILTGGTGISRRDVSLEVVEALFEKRLDGFGELFRMLSFAEIGPAAMLSRAAAGTYRGALLFALLLSVPLGVFAALRPNTLIDRIALGVAVAGQAMPSFLFGLGLIYVFGVKLGWLPFSGAASWDHFILPAIALGYYAPRSSCG